MNSNTTLHLLSMKGMMKVIFKNRFTYMIIMRFPKTIVLTDIVILRSRNLIML